MPKSKREDDGEEGKVKKKAKKEKTEKETPKKKKSKEGGEEKEEGITYEMRLKVRHAERPWGTQRGPDPPNALCCQAVGPIAKPLAPKKLTKKLHK